MDRAAAVLLFSTFALSGCGSSPTGNSGKDNPYPPEKPPLIATYGMQDLDFSFAENAVPYRQDVLASINQLMRSDPRCIGGTMMEGTLVSVHSKRSSNPLLQIACTNSDGLNRAVVFHAKDAAHSVVREQPQPLTKSRAIAACQELMSVKIEYPVVINPASVVFKNAGASFLVLRGRLSAKSREYVGECLFGAGGIIKGNIIPNGGRHAL